ncbi:hypothetical protein A8B75_07985 [Sphingomonadales bacterium EhC05]|nr:hypothetical protein A8B75_07985 [Sphingomonadales bacterium EhC05]
MNGFKKSQDFSRNDLLERAFGDIAPFEGMESDLDDYGTQGLALAILGIALTNELDSQSKAVLRGFYDALSEDKNGIEWQLKLKRRRRGKYLTHDQRRLKDGIDVLTLRWVDWITKQTGKQEVGIQEIMDRDNIDRSTVFAMLKRARKIDENRKRTGKKNTD